VNGRPSFLLADLTIELEALKYLSTFTIGVVEMLKYLRGAFLAARQFDPTKVFCRIGCLFQKPGERKVSCRIECLFLNLGCSLC
jgi:hypothetical protein